MLGKGAAEEKWVNAEIKQEEVVEVGRENWLGKETGNRDR